jgi:hypothetical protein
MNFYCQQHRTGTIAVIVALAGCAHDPACEERADHATAWEYLLKTSTDTAEQRRAVIEACHGRR